MSVITQNVSDWYDRRLTANQIIIYYNNKLTTEVYNDYSNARQYKICHFHVLVEGDADEDEGDDDYSDNDSSSNCTRKENLVFLIDLY